jgi:WD40 repeat protein
MLCLIRVPVQAQEKALLHPRFLCSLKGSSSSVECLAISPDASKLAMGSSDNCIKVFEVRGIQNAQPQNPISFSLPGTDYPSVCDFTRDGQSLVAVSGIA